MGTACWEEQPYQLGLVPIPVLKTLPGDVSHHSLPLLGTKKKFKTQFSQKIDLWLGVAP